MHLEFLDYDLPANLIAQHPSAERDEARLLILRRRPGTIEHGYFRQLPELLAPGDLLVLNDTRVLPARLLGHRSRTGGKWEGLFLQVTADGFWELLCHTRGHLMAGETIGVEPGPLELHLLKKTDEGHWLASPSLAGAPLELLERHGNMPLPPYIRKGHGDAVDRERYQTIFARQAGAVAAPTAGLHFTPQLFERLKQRSIDWTFVTLHVSAGTFQPIQAPDYRRHNMHQEWGELPASAAAAINGCCQRGSRIIAVGTTSVRVLETVAASGSIKPWSGTTDLYIYPSFQFRIVNAMITNFHLPRSTLLLLAGAFAGVELLEQAYRKAIEGQYRFYSYGDAMLIL